MVKKWIDWINYTIVCLIILLIIGAGFFWLKRPKTISTTDFMTRQSSLPLREFARPQEEYNKIGEPALKLAFSPLTAQLPNLSIHLLYYGKNGRPDADPEHPVMFFGFGVNKPPVQMVDKERLYIFYDKGQIPNQYVFSPNNAKTHLWIEATPQIGYASIHVTLIGENGEVIQEPGVYANFNTAEKEYSRFGGVVWEIDNSRVDGTFLVKQKARWYGVDKFIEKYGGDEFKEWQQKQRLDFGEGENFYAVYLSQGDCLYWSDHRWHLFNLETSPRNTPLLCIKKIDERMLTLELWDEDGKNKLILNLIKSSEAWNSKNLENAFKFVGARTRSQLIFEINDERMLLKPHDWLILDNNEWRKLQTPEDIDLYVERKLIGPLFIFDRIERKDDRTVVFGTFFNAARTHSNEVEFTVQQAASPQNNNDHQMPNKRKTKEDPSKKQTKDSRVLKPVHVDDAVDD